MAKAARCTRTHMSDAPISAPESGNDRGVSALIAAAWRFESGDTAAAAKLWRDQAMPILAKAWPDPLGDAAGRSVAAVLRKIGNEPSGAEPAARRAAAAWQEVEGWLGERDLPLAAGRSTPAHFRKERRDPATYRAVALRGHVQLAGAARAVALNLLGNAWAAQGRHQQAVDAYREAAELRRQAFGWREAGLATLLVNLAEAERAAGLHPAGAEGSARLGEVETSERSGSDRFLELARGTTPLRRRLLAVALLVPILKRRGD